MHQINRNCQSGHEASWLYTVTKNEAISHLRKKKYEISIEEIYDAQSSDNWVNEIIDREKYVKIISRLNNKEKEIVSLKILADLSFNEISKFLKEPVGTVKWRYYKAVHTLKLLIGNLSLFIITFMIGIRSMLINNKQNEIIDQEQMNNTELDSNKIENSSTNDSLNRVQEETKIDLSTELKDESESIKQETQIVENTKIEKTNYSHIGILGVSGLFFIITIVLISVSLRYKYKAKKK